MSNRPYNPIISIPRADYVGRWLDFLAENAPFVTDHEITRIETALKHTGSAVHVASSAGDFEILVTK